MANKPDNTSLQVKISRIHATHDTIARIVTSLIKWGALCFISWMGATAIHDLAGKETLANFDLGARLETKSETVTSSTIGLTNSTSLAILGLIFGFGGILYGRQQARLRKDTVERLHQYQLKYEQTIDPNRTSSTLTVRGETRPEDKYE